MEYLEFKGGKGWLFCAILFCFSPGCFSSKLHHKKIPGISSAMNRQIDMPSSDMSGNDIENFCNSHLQAAKELKKELVNYTDKDNFIDALNIYNDLLIHVDKAMNRAGLMAQVHPDAEIRKAAEHCEREISTFVNELTLDEKVFAVLSKGEGQELSPEARRLRDRTMSDFRRAGVEKDPAVKKRIAALKDELIKVGQEFGENIRSERLVIKLDNESDLDGLPKDYIAAHAKGPDGKIEISTDYPDFQPFMNYAKSNKYRAELHFKFLNRGQKNGPILRSMIDKRHELAQLLGYSSYADYIAEDKMIKNAKNIHDFIDQISEIAKDGADREYAALLEYKKQNDPKATAVVGSESSFLENNLRKEKFDFDAKLFRPYFSYEKVLNGLLSVSSEIFDIRYEPVHDVALWHKSVRAYDVFNEAGRLGQIYLDMHPRAGKYQHAAEFALVSGLQGRQYPEATLVCNFPEPKNDEPALLELQQVVTMFHEFGHLLHHIFAVQKYVPISGITTEWDFVETPSQFFEELARSKDVLQRFAHHYQSGEVLPSEFIRKMEAAREFGKALSARTQIFYAALSANYFDKDPRSFEPLELLKTLQARYSYFPYVEGTHFHHNFGHLDGYSAMYYTYMWSLSIAKDLLTPFRDVGLLDKVQAGRLRSDPQKRRFGRCLRFGKRFSWTTI